MANPSTTPDQDGPRDVPDERVIERTLPAKPVPDRAEAHDVPDERVIERTLPARPVQPGGTHPKDGMRDVPP